MSRPWAVLARMQCVVCAAFSSAGQPADLLAFAFVTFFAAGLHQQ